MSTKPVKESGYDRLCGGFIKGASNLAGVLVGRARSVAGGLSIQRRAESDWLAVLRVYDNRNSLWLVAFGSGADMIAALMNLNAQIASGKFSRDKFDRGRVPDWTVSDLEDVLPAAGGQGSLQ